MPCFDILDDGKRVGVLCTGGSIYDYGGFLFEAHSYMGPCPLHRTTHSPRVRIPNDFWRMWERFEKLSVEEQITFRVSE